jgi:general secretion pathway protein G
MKSQQPRLKDQADYQRLTARLLTGVGGGDFGREYVDIKRLAGFILDNGSPFAQMLLPSSVLGRAYPIDWALLPLTETFTSKLFGLATVSTWDANGITSDSYSPMGRTVGSFFIGASLAFVGMRASSESYARSESAIEAEFSAQSVTQAIVDLHAFSEAVKSFQRVENRLPTDDEWPHVLFAGSKNHSKPYLENVTGYDPWGYPYILKKLPGGKFTIMSNGSDGEPGGYGHAADISSEMPNEPAPHPGR